MRPAIKNRILAVLAVLLLGVGILTSCVVFTDFMSHIIYEESTAHLTEIYHQANQTLYNKVSLNWGVMRMWTPYLECAQSDADVRSFLAQAKEEYQFTDFFFVSRDGSYITLDGEQGYLDLGRMLSQLVLEQRPIVANSVVPDKPEIMVFAVPTEKGSYQGFAYEAIAVTYNNKDLVDSLKISAFEGHGSTFAVLPDGRVVLDSSSEDMRGVHNILAMLKNSAGFTDEQITALQKAFAAGNTGNLEFSINGVGYYMVYGSAAFQSWTILGIVPKSVVNANMNRLQYTTMAVMTSIVGMLAVAVLLLVVQSNRQKLQKKDQQLLAREELFSSLSRNVDDVFLITFYFSVAQVKHFQTVRERSDPEFVSVQAKSSYIEDLFFFFCQVIFLNFFTVYIVFEESFLGTYPDNTVKIILVKRVYDWIIRDNMLVEYLIFGYDMNCSGLIG